MAGRPADPRTRARLLAAATEVMLNQGLAAASVDTVCQVAGLSKGAFFHYFAEKQQITSAVLQAWVEQGMSMFADAPFAQAETALRRVLGYVDFVASVTEQMKVPGCMVGILTQEGAAANPALRAQCAAAFDGWAQEVRALLAAAAPKHVSPSQLDDLARHFLATFEGALILARAHEDSSLVRKQLDLYKSLLCATFAHQETGKARKR